MTTCPLLAWKNLPASALRNKPDLSAEWDRLNAARADLPFLAANAMIAALEIFGDGSERLVVGHHGSSIATMFLVAPLGKLRWRTFQPSQIPLGAWVAEAHLPLREVARSLNRGSLGLCLSLSITQVDPLFAPRSEDTDDSQSNDYVETAWIDLQGTFEDYWASRGKNLRQNMRKQRNRLAAEGIAGQMRSWVASSDMAPAIERYGALESAGWKAAIGTAIHPDNAQGRFYRRLFEVAAQRGEAIVYEYLFGDRVVASNLCLQRNGTLFIMKTTYDESIQAYSPAFLLSQDEIQHLYHEHTINRIEYYGRVMEWHTKWTDSKRTIYHLTLYRSRLLKNLAEWRRDRLANEPGMDKIASVFSVFGRH